MELVGGNFKSLENQIIETSLNGILEAICVSN
jgi:hypothetical protein